jgi:hypothetical protein
MFPGSENGEEKDDYDKKDLHGIKKGYISVESFQCGADFFRKNIFFDGF